MQPHLLLPLLLLVAVAVTVTAQSRPSVTGNCVTGTYTFTRDRVYALRPGELGKFYPPVLEGIDPERYDFTIDYGESNAELNPGGGGGVNIRIVKEGAYGARLSTTRYVLYGRFTMRVKATTAKGLITTFITMSDVGDEID
ncbi:hypothetical protein HDU67_009934, partial [Dinochytrium kinnereticum]